MKGGGDGRSLIDIENELAAHLPVLQPIQLQA